MVLIKKVWSILIWPYTKIKEEIAFRKSIENGTESSQVYSDLVVPEFNKISIRKSAGQYLYFINEVRLDNMQFFALNGNEFGLSFGGDAGLMIEIDHIKLYYLD